MLSGESINRIADRFVRPEINVVGHDCSAFKVWGCAAFILAALMGGVLARQRGFPFWALMLEIALSFLTFYVVALSTKILTGEESLTFYHQLITVTAVISGAAWLMSQPVLPALDVSMIAVGSTLTFGRIGCLMVGCCHGRPYSFGVRYNADHAAAGFTQLLVGIRLFPIQAVEFLCVIPIEIVGCYMIWHGYAPGAAASWFVASYCSTRFCFEFARWPPSYQFKWGLSQYQWISVVLVLFVAGLEFTGALPFQRWHIGLAIVLLLATAVAVLERRLRSFHKDLNHPDHLRELASAIDLACWRAETLPTPGKMIGRAIPLSGTSLGLRISASRIFGVKGELYHYAFSSLSGRLTDATATVLAKLIVGSKHPSGRPEVVKGSRGVFHVLIH